MDTTPLIVQVIRKYHPDFEPPKDTGRTWIKCRCPFHGDDHASAGISYELDSFKCLACPVRGNSTTLISQREGVSHREADRRAAELSPQGHTAVQPEPKRKRSRRIFGEEGSRGSKHPPVVPTRVRRRPPPWT